MVRRYLPWLTAFATLTLGACSHSAPDPAAQEAAAAAHIASIPAANPAKFHDIHGSKSWKNPYLIVKPDGVALLDVANNEEHILNPDELTQKLAQLPETAWPYGRTVAVTEAVVTSEHDKAEIRKNKAIVAGTLEGMHVTINWIPAA